MAGQLLITAEAIPGKVRSGFAGIAQTKAQHFNNSKRAANA
ncbi:MULTISPECIES: hypothetical protein [Rhizobium]|nr:MULTISPECIES: hypothetical protein [Rhizobium]